MVTWQTNKIRSIFGFYHALFNSPLKYLNGLSIKHIVSDSVNTLYENQVFQFASWNKLCFLQHKDS